MVRCLLRRRLIFLSMSIFTLLVSLWIIIVQQQLVPFGTGHFEGSTSPPQYRYYVSLRDASGINETTDSQSEVKCKPHRPSKAGSEQIHEHYGQPERIEDRKCDETHYPDICAFQVTESGHNKLSCDAEVCGSSDIQIASVNPEMGKAVSDWKPLPNDTITANVQEAVKTNLERGFSFLFLRCGKNFQVLTFPPILEKVVEGKNKSRININVIMLDSISRPHFYRIMPRAVEALRKIVQDPNIKATALDFELAQSIGQQTFENLRPFFSGVLKDDNKISASGKNTKAPLGVGVLYGTFQKWGYQTLFQEDLCWYDMWGSALTDIEKRDVPSDDAEFKSRWQELQAKLAKANIDHYGLTHFSCTVVNELDRTNHYDYPDKVCFNGQFFSWYFMDYIKKVYTALKNEKKAKPLFSFMHFNTGHEKTGVRIANLDANLAKLFVDLAGLRDTLTMIFADHGHTRTPFADTEEGRRELFDPTFFMIVPDGVKEKLGPQRMAALETNQKRLFILQDVHKALMSLHDPEKMNSQNFLQTGIFSVIPANRTCADLFILPLTRCKCEGFDEEGHIQDNAENHKWLAEFALATLNDAIQKQYIEGNATQVTKSGFGNCERLVGKTFTNIVKSFQGEYIITSMDIHVAPPYGYEEDEIYKVSIKQYAKPEQGVFFLSFIRQTTYNKFVACVDKSVDIKLCACAKERTANITKNGVLFENGVPRKMFGSKTIVKDLDSNCLLYLRRNYGSFSFALEVANVCTDRTYKFELTGSMDDRIFANTVPLSRELPPKTFYFLTSAYKYISKVHTSLDLKANIQVMKEDSQEFKDLETVELS